MREGGREGGREGSEGGRNRSIDPLVGWLVGYWLYDCSESNRIGAKGNEQLFHTVGEYVTLNIVVYKL